MKTKSLFIAAIICVAAITGCKKNQNLVSDKSTKNSTTQDSVANGDLVMTPFGPRLKTDVHNVEDGYALSYQNGHLLKVLKQTGKIAEDFGVQATVKNLAANPKQNLTTFSKSQKTVPGLGSGWITYAYWSNNTGIPISSFTTTWAVPSNPTVYHSQLLYLFNGIEDAGNPGHILQPVLQFGPNGSFGGNYWCIANWYASCATCPAFHSTPTTVVYSTTLTGLMEQTAHSGSNFSYKSSFVGYPAGNALQVSNVPELTWASQTLEAYSMSVAADYTPDLKVNMSAIRIKTGTTDASLYWTPVNSVTDVGQHTITVSNSSPGGEVDLYFRMATNQLMSGAFFKNNCSAGQGGGVNYVVPAGKYTDITQAAADAQAQAEINANGQAYANANGTCNFPYTFGITTNNASSTSFMMIVNGQNISGPRTTAPQGQVNNVSSTMSTPSNSTVVMQVTYGYMPHSAVINGPFAPVTGVISGSNITFSNVNLSIGSSASITLN